MHEQLSQNGRVAENRGGRPENGLLLRAEPVMNAQAVLDDVRKFNDREAGLLRALAEERERMTRRVNTVLTVLCLEIASRERVGIR
jgi:hypothetical protein